MTQLPFFNLVFVVVREEKEAFTRKERSFVKGGKKRKVAVLWVEKVLTTKKIRKHITRVVFKSTQNSFHMNSFRTRGFDTGRTGIVSWRTGGRMGAFAKVALAR